MWDEASESVAILQGAGRRLARWTSGFLVLGIVLRLARFGLNYPLWWDESFLAVNFLRRGYLDLLRPLDYGQVCPVLFLWAERATVGLLGFSEASLRLVPLACAIASLFLFRFVASRILAGFPLLMAVSIFAVSFHPIRHAADVKPYASDLLAALVLLAPAVAWWRERESERTVWLWRLAAVSPLAVAVSHPSIFVALGIALGLLPAALKRSRRATLAALTYVSAASATFLALYVLVTRSQAAATLEPMRAQWVAAFPPRTGPLALIKWLAMVHTGGMFGYPCGGENGASTATFLVVVVGAVVLWRRGERTITLALLGPFAMTLIASALRRYPYGGVAHGSPARVAQYLAPSICLLAGLGAGWLIEQVKSPGRRYRLRVMVLAGLCGAGVAPLALDAAHPYRAVHAERARAFARAFWPDFDRDAEPVCLRWDVEIEPWDATNLNVAVYLCNQRIYSPRRKQGLGPNLRAVSATRPIRCVLPLADPTSPRVAAWLRRMSEIYQLRSSRSMDVNMAEPEAPPRVEHYTIYEFTPDHSAATWAPFSATDRRIRKTSGIRASESMANTQKQSK